MAIRRFSIGVVLALVLLAIIIGVSSNARAAAVCTPTSTVSGAYAQNGAGDVCFQTANLCSYINSWNLSALEVNGTDYTNRWVDSRTISQLNGAYIVHYVGSFPWSHFEIGGTCGTVQPTTPPVTTPPVTTPPVTTPPVTTPPVTTPPVTTPPPGSVSINSGGPATGSFSADQYFSGGSTYTNTRTIDVSQIPANTAPAAIFSTERYGTMTYTIPNRSGTQTVTLYFVETYVTAAGQRVFNVSINGAAALSNFDIFAAAGGANRAIARSFSTTANASGQVVIQFTAVTQNPKISGLTVSGGGTPPATTPPVTTPPVTTPPVTTPPVTTPPVTTPPATTPPVTTPPVTTPPGTHLANPFVGATIYRNVDYTTSVNAAADRVGGTLGTRMRQVATYPTFVWMDSIAAVNGTNGYTRSLVGHMQQAVAQGANAIEIVVYDLPNRDCSALASNGELLIAQDGFNRYKNEYINPIASAVAQFPNLRVIAVIEPDSLPNLHTNLSFAKCQEANGTGGYRDGIVYALNTLGQYSNFYSYIDIGHHGWLGWQDSNFIPAGTLIANTIKAANKGVNSIDGFISNTANTSALVEPYHTANQSIGGQPARSAKFHDWNTYIDELSYAQAWRQNMINNGFPSGIGMLIDTSRNGWGGPNRPSGPSTSTDLNTFVDQSRIDRRIHKGNWCNQSGAGIGTRPVANPATGLDAYVWVKPPGESDGSSTDIPIGPDNPAGKGFDRMCDPTYTGNSLNGNNMTGALPGAPVSGRWFQAQFEQLVTNAFPAFQ